MTKKRRRYTIRTGLQQGEDLADLVMLILGISVVCAIVYQVGVWLGLWV